LAFVFLTVSGQLIEYIRIWLFFRAKSGFRREIGAKGFLSAPLVFIKHGNDPPERVIGLALASTLILKMSYLVFPGFLEVGKILFYPFGPTVEPPPPVLEPPPPVLEPPLPVLEPPLEEPP
jgi:hypothetical protein